MAKKILTVQQAETAKRRAALFVDNVLDDPDRADEIEDESLEEWAEETGRTIKSNPQRKNTMPQATPTKADLQETLDQIQDILEDAYTPEATREDAIAALGTALDVLNGEDTDDDDSDDDDSDDEDDDSEDDEDPN